MDSGLDKMYRDFASLFAATFGVTDNAVLAEVNAAGHRLGAYFVAVDNVVDGDLEPVRGAIECTRLVMTGFRHLTSLGGDHDRFWSTFFPATERWLEAFDTEQDFASGRRLLNELGTDEMTALAADRGCVAVGTPALLASVSVVPDTDERLARIARSIDTYSIAQQLRDDVLDWRADLAARRPNFVLAALAPRHDLEAEPEPELARAIHTENVGLELLWAASEQTLAAGEAVADIAPRWSTILATASRTLTDVLTFVQRMEPPVRSSAPARRFAIRLDPSRLDDPRAFEGVKALLLAYQRPSSLRHPMMFPVDSGVSKPGIYVGDVFSRAMALNCLAAVDQELGGLGELIASEAEVLMGRRDPDGARLWRYFPGFYDLSPDLDTFAEVGSALLASGQLSQEVREVYLAIADEVVAAARSSGTLETWIFTGSATRDIEQRAADRLWGRTQDPEVAANFLWFLLSLDAERYHAPVRELVDLVFGAQAAALRSTWYTDCGYAEYVLVRLLRRSGGDQVRHLEQAVQRSQRLAQAADEFGMLRDAFYLLVVSLLDDDPVRRLVDDQQVEASRERLTRDCPRAGTPTPEPFIHMDLSRAGPLTGDLFFASEIVQRAWVVRALTASGPPVAGRSQRSELTRAR